ncbi:MAG: 16S rRNA (guanine(527)-N(7))-methyltransferase RsmG [Propionibacteriaceae bacterium]
MDAAEIAQEIYGDNYKTISRYVDILATRGIEWGLLGPREVPRLWDRHVLNSAAVSLRVPNGADMLDIGSGAGLPGIPIAVLRPDLEITLLEPLQRRALFLDQAVDELGIADRVTVIRGRAEDVDGLYDVVTARAVTALGALTQLALPHFRSDGFLLALKGQKVHEEITAATKTFRKLKVQADVETVQLHAELEPATLAVVARI